MPKVFRHDSITLRSGVNEADFERFMTAELLPYFSENYKGPTRASRADIKGQTLLKSGGRANTSGSRRGMAVRRRSRVRRLSRRG